MRLSSIIKYTLITLFVFLLIGVRAVQHQLFFDPLIEYYQYDYLQLPFPIDLPFFKMIISYSFRFLINTILSLAILKLYFEKQYTWWHLISIYLIFYIIFFGLFFGLLFSKVDIGGLFPFYIRRFMIHPLLFILLFPILFLQSKERHF